jgi:hypothetical protein
LTDYFGGWIDNVIMRVMDVLLAFRAIAGNCHHYGPRSRLINACLRWHCLHPACAPCASVLSVQKWISFSNASWDMHDRSFRRILPNTDSAIVQGTLGIASAIPDAAALSSRLWRYPTPSGVHAWGA